MIDHQDALNGPHFDRELFTASGGFLRLHKGGGAAPKPNKKMEAMQMKLMQAQLRQAGQKVEMPNMDFPEAAPPPPPPPPPSSTSSIDVQEAATDSKRQALKRSGYQSTLLAGETGGYKGNSTLGGNKTLLG